MMRWILALLLLVNLGLFFWTQMHAVPSRSLTPKIIRPPGVQDILLLREAGQRQSVALATEPEPVVFPVPEESSLPEAANDMLQEVQAPDLADRAISDVPETAAVILAPEPEAEQEEKPEPAAGQGAGPEEKPKRTAEPVCGRIGPYEDKETAEKYRDGLLRPGISLDIVRTTEQVRNGYWVLIPALPNTQEALQMVERLKAAGVTDLWRFPEGPMKNIISLGWYLGVASATKVAEDIKEKGFEPEVRPKMSGQTRYWLNYTATGEQALAGGLDNLSAGLENEKKACE